MRQALASVRMKLDPLVCACRMARQTAHLMVGLQDYDAYAAHVRATHPDVEPMDRATFYRQATDRRYGGGPGSAFRCC
ncbi:YbdD/YjiX family protein [Methylopila henanensis]|uniref:YbdD/YjiX family protein n=1 Tax=Methylopila henanensis TaxID=873516 RepID=A0ABW4K496_9HYPH